jgi:hypothetical protein
MTFRRLLASLVAAIGLGTAALAQPAEAPVSAAGLDAFATVFSVLVHPRCQNCHTRTGWPRQGDDRHRHVVNVHRGPDGRGVAGMTCAACHGRANNEWSGVPGADEDWHLAPLSMGWEGLPAAEVCRNLLDPSRNGGRSGAEVVNHLRTHLVQWAWEPGRTGRGADRSRPPVPYDEFVRAAEAWVAAGAPCPA